MQLRAADLGARRSGVETLLLGGSAAIAAAGVGALSVAMRKARPERPERAEPTPEDRSGSHGGEPELPDEPLGVPADEPSGDGDVELPGFPRSDPSHG